MTPLIWFISVTVFLFFLIIIGRQLFKTSKWIPKVILFPRFWKTRSHKTMSMTVFLYNLTTISNRIFSVRVWTVNVSCNIMSKNMVIITWFRWLYNWCTPIQYAFMTTLWISSKCTYKSSKNWNFVFCFLYFFAF